MNVSDLFNTRKWRQETETPTFETNSEFQWRRGPTVTVSFTYRINQNDRRSRRGGGRPDGGGGGDFDEF